MSRKSQPLFPNLPLELRELIYRFALLPENHPPSAHRKDFSAADSICDQNISLPSFLPTLCRVNEATRIQVGLWYIRCTEICILYPATTIHFARFLDTFPNNQGFEAVRRLDFPLFGRHCLGSDEVNPYIELMKRCSRLTEIRLKFGFLDLVQKAIYPPAVDWDGGERAMPNLENIVDIYGLRDLFDLRSLTKITILLCPRLRPGLRNKFLCLSYTTRLEGLRDWLKIGCWEHGNKVSVVLESDGTGDYFRSGTMAG